MIGLVDTNLFNKLAKNVDGIHDTFVGTLGQELDNIVWITTPFGLLEYLGLSFRGSVQVGPMPQGWTFPERKRDEYRGTIDALGIDYASNVYWVRINAREEYSKRLTATTLKTKIADEKKYHSEAFCSGRLVGPLFRHPIAAYSVEAIVELLSIDFLHRYHEFPANLMPMARQSRRFSLLSEYYIEKRNIALVRGFKEAWYSRTKGIHESIVSPATMFRLNRAMGRLKNDADRLDHDLLAYFLLGFTAGDKYEPVTIYTQDDPDEVLCRLAIFASIVMFTWDEAKSIEGLGPLPFQLSSKFRFVSDAGAIKQEINFGDLAHFLVGEKLLVSSRTLK
ncbi:MAG TPA: hypothetical protein VGP07_12305 [Polyangia bacterium]|jgi:hypothetical protein